MRELTNMREREAAANLCMARNHEPPHDDEYCPTCRADIVRLVDPPAPSTGTEPVAWRKKFGEEAERELADRVQRAKAYLRNPAWDSADAWDFAEALLDLAAAPSLPPAAVRREQVEAAIRGKAWSVARSAVGRALELQYDFEHGRIATQSQMAARADALASDVADALLALYVEARP